ncbi:MAG TPA: SpoIIE family protein phosphatase [Gaiellaceae bacterium]|nr:SpoIIE family protein phosphatase [Gaiellaceae bacterium]
MAVGVQRPPIEALAEAARQVASGTELRPALAAIAAGVAEALGANLVAVRAVGDDGELVARSVAPEGSTLAAEVAGTHADAGRLAEGLASAAVVRAAERAGAAVLAVPAFAGDRLVGAVEIVRHEPFAEDEVSLAALAAAQVGLAVRSLAPGAHALAPFRRLAWLDLAGEALAVGWDAHRTAEQALRVAAAGTGARGGVLWQVPAEGPPFHLAALGDVAAMLPAALRLVEEELTDGGGSSAPRVEVDHRLPAALSVVATVRLGRPMTGVLQLFYSPDASPTDADLQSLSAFAARAAHALRSGDHARAVEQELGRTRALFEVVSEAVSRLSLGHTLETAIERTSELLQVDALGIYLKDNDQLLPAAGRGVAGGHVEVAQRASEAFLGPLRARSSLQVNQVGRDAALARLRAALRKVGEESVVAVPLHVQEESIGVLVAYPGERELSESDLALLTALAAQLAVAVQNARLHERATDLGNRLYDVLELEREASRRVTAFYEISRSFTQTLSLDTTLDAVTTTLVEQLGVDAAVIRVPDERGDQLVAHKVHVPESRLDAAVSTILARPQPLRAQRREPLLLDAAVLARLGGAHALLGPFLEAGSTAALLPIVSATELLAELTIVSLDPAEPITEETLASALPILRQAALAIDNARLYQQQKEFTETMQRSLLPRELPAVNGLDVGSVYESAARVDVGGDVYDFLELTDGRLAVVLGDVTGHGIEATADMAMAKFVFRSLAREHSDPGEFLARANDVVVDEIALGKFITMTYLTVDAPGNVLCACAGHPPPRLLEPDGTVRELECGGLALGIASPQEYAEVSATLQPGAAVVLYTDGVIESRRGRELFGVERLDEVLAQSSGRPAQEVANAVLLACRGFAGGDLADDCAIVVLRRSP